MRVFAYAALAALLASASSGALASSFLDAVTGGGAASCNKGMLWPYVRNPGDCLTDAEIAAGQRGSYSGPVNTNPDVGAMAPPPPPPVAPAGPVIPGVTTPPGSVVVPQPYAQGAAPAMAVAPAANQNYRTVTSFSCTKGVTWPFVRKPGDCLTTTEKKRGMKGVFGGGDGLTVTQVAVSQPIVVQAQPGQVVQGQVAQAQVAPTYVAGPQGQVYVVQPAAAPAPAATPACTKGALWPFIKKPGDCQSGADKPKKN